MSCPEYNAKIFNMAQLIVKMINGTTSSPENDVIKTQVVANNYIYKVLTLDSQKKKKLVLFASMNVQ